MAVAAATPVLHNVLWKDSIMHSALRHTKQHPTQLGLIEKNLLIQIEPPGGQGLRGFKVNLNPKP
jgi:hypothetical protein